MMSRLFWVVVAYLSVSVSRACVIEVSNEGGSPVSPLQYGLFFEDISHSGDGGIYAELISNRAFQANSSQNATLAPWGAVGSSTISLNTNDTAPLSSALPYSVHVTPAQGGGVSGISNGGYWGIDVRPQVYTGSFYARGAYNGSFTVSLQNFLTGESYASKDLQSNQGSGNDWIQYNYTLNPVSTAANSNNTFSLSFNGTSPLDFNLISLFPPTFNGRPNGMRIDLMQDLMALNPSFLRFPGGNNLEGEIPNDHWRWNETIGPLTQRPGRWGAWGYYNTDGLGLDEYFGWCEDLDMEPILAVFDGHYLNNDTDTGALLQDDLQSALNELEYILGNSSTQYGALRASYGHPDPYKLRYVEIGNEDNLSDGLDSYPSRFQLFSTAISQAYPDINIIASTQNITLPAGDAGDFHLYSRPDQFVQFNNYFASNTSSNPVLLGEFGAVEYNSATDTEANYSTPFVEFPFWLGSVAEAIYLLGAEANTKSGVLGAAYAPLLENLNAPDWTPDLISFAADPAATLRSTSFHVLALLSGTRFTTSRNTTYPTGSRQGDGGAYWAVGENTDTGAFVLKAAVYNASEDASFSVTFPVAQGHPATLTVLLGPNGPASSNAPGTPEAVVEQQTNLTASATGEYSFCLPQWSVAVLVTQGSQPGGFGGLYGDGGYGGCKNGAQRASYDWPAWVASGRDGNGC